MDYVCTAVRFAMDQLRVYVEGQQKEATTLFEAMTVSSFCHRGTGTRYAMPCCLSCSTIFEREHLDRSSVVACISPLVMDQLS